MIVFYSRYLLFFLLTATLVYTLWWGGLLEPLFEQDETKITFGISLLFLIGMVMLGIKAELQLWYSHRDQWVARIEEALPLVGLTGTIVGLKIAIEGVTLEEASLVDLGVGTALNTTLAGLVCSMWLRLGRWLVR